MENGGNTTRNILHLVSQKAQDEDERLAVGRWNREWVVDE